MYARYQRDFNKAIDGDYIVQNLTDVSSWSAIFENPQLTDNKQKMKMLSLGIDNLITCHSEISPITMTYFVVSLKPGFGAKKLVEEAGENLTSLVADKHYSLLQGMAMVNKDYFRIHYCKRVLTTAVEYTSAETGGSNPLSTFKRFYHKIKFPRWLNDGESSWEGMNSNAVPLGSRLYCLIFNDNSALDIESPNLKQNVVVTVKH